MSSTDEELLEEEQTTEEETTIRETREEETRDDKITTQVPFESTFNIYIPELLPEYSLSSLTLDEHNTQLFTEILVDYWPPRRN